MWSCVIELGKECLKELGSCLCSCTKEEVSLFIHVAHEVEQIRRDLDSKLVLLIPRAEQKAKSDELIGRWLSNVRQAEYEVEDAVREYKDYMERKERRSEEINCETGFREFVLKLGCFLSSFCSAQWKKRGSARLIKDLKTKIGELREESERYDLIQESTGDGASDSPVRPSPYVDKSQPIIGIESAIGDLYDRLVNGSRELTVIPVFGDGGIGKSTLARQLYDRVSQDFDCCVWVLVPYSPYNRAAVLRELEKEILNLSTSGVEEGMGPLVEQKLIKKIRDLLSKKKYFIVFDDVWEENFWSHVEDALVDNKNGGRVMFTTRNEVVVKLCKRLLTPYYTHKMEPLLDPEAQELFWKRAFRSDSSRPTDPDLLRLGHQIVQSCAGLPLAILAVAGIMSCKDKSEWSKFYKEMEKDLKNVLDILSLSYMDLPHHLRRCFLYFGMFPKYSEIRNGRLIREWIALGYVQQQDGESLEEQAQSCMDELISRSLVEASSLDRTRKKSKRCRVHDLYHKIILKESANIRFSRVVGDQLTISNCITRHLSFINASKEELEKTKAPHAHSAIVFSEDKMLNDAVPEFAKSFKFLKVLDFEDFRSLNHLPEAVGELFDLRYLSVRRTDVKMLPRSIHKLHNLETLDLKRSAVVEIPTSAIRKLLKLRYLYAGGVTEGLKFTGGIGSLTSLRKLCMVDIDEDEAAAKIIFAELINLTQLRALGVKLRTKDGAVMCACLEKMGVLQSLVIDSPETIDIESVRSPPLDLNHIFLRGTLTMLPSWFARLKSLVKLRLIRSKLTDEDIQVIKKMHNLLELQLCNESYDGEHLQFEAGSLPNLKVLWVLYETRLRRFTVHETALPMLETLHIGHAPLENVPSGLQYLQNLKVLNFQGMPAHFKNLDFQSVKHVPSVTFSIFEKNPNDGTLTLVREYINSDFKHKSISDRQGRIVEMDEGQTSSVAEMEGEMEYERE